METNSIFYLCPKCFDTFETEPTNHQHAVLRIDTTQLDVESRKPLMDKQGNLLSSAPRWFLEATGMISPRRPTSGTMAA
ncbi:MAG TPA: hypothetical protein VMP08_26685 [Anaerolineae bacterium]|nr:hypothetical protein [Anaerolineae bacterium]